MKTDKSIHNICIAAIKRHTIKPYDFKWTKFYDFNTEIQHHVLINDLAETELIICSTIIDDKNYSLLTTKRLLTKQEGQLSAGEIQGATDKRYGDFKGYKDKDYTLGKVELQNGTELNYFIEAGKASMAMIYGVRTLIKTTQTTDTQVEKVTRIWKKQNEK